MDSLIFELQIVFYFQLFLSANVRHKRQGVMLWQKSIFSKANFCSVYFNNLRGNFFYEILGVVSNTGVLFSSNNLIEELIVLRNVGRFLLGDLFWLFWPFLESRAKFCKVLSTLQGSASFWWLVYVFNRSFQQTVFGEDWVSSQWICIWVYCITDSKPQNLHFSNFFNKFLTCHIFHLCRKTTTARKLC